MPFTQMRNVGATVHAVPGELTQADIEELGRKRVRNLSLDEERGWSGKGLELLTDAKGIKNIAVGAVARLDVSVLNEFKWLEGLGVSGAVKGAIEISNIAGLRRFATYVTGRRLQVSGLSRLQQLESFAGRCQKNVAEDLCGIKSLKYVRLVGGEIEDLSFLSGSAQMYGLELMGIKTLASIDALAEMSDLKLFKMTSVRNVRNYEAMRALSKLDFLYMDDCSCFDSLEFSSTMDQLAFASFTGATCVNDGDLSLLLRPSVKHAQVDNYAHYNVVDSDLPKNISAAVLRYQSFEGASTLFQEE